MKVEMNQDHSHATHYSFKISSHIHLIKSVSWWCYHFVRSKVKV